MKKRYVLDGPPGSGKSTVLFGISDGDENHSSVNTIESMDYHCFHESVAEAHAALQRKGIDFAKEKETWLRTIVEIDRAKHAAAVDGINFYDRCFHHWKAFSEGSEIPLPDWYDDANATIRYDDPVFVVEPIESMDLTAPEIHESRRFTWEHRKAMLRQTKELYLGLGYTVIEVPVFIDGDIERNNRERIDFILGHIV